MKIMIVHNEYGKFSGEEAVVQGQKALLEQYGHDVCLFTRSSAAIPSMFLGKLRAFFSGIFNPFARHAFNNFLQIHRPDIIHIHNLFPLLSPSILLKCHVQRRPVVMTVHNYRLICPNGLFMTGGKICERCAGGREYWCVWNSCEGNFMKSLGYALRNYSARFLQCYLKNVTCYAALTYFQRTKLIDEGYPSEKIFVIPNMTDLTAKTETEVGNFIGYVGRISPEKSVDTLISAAYKCENIPFIAAGSYEKLPELPKGAPANFQFLGQLNRPQVEEFITLSRIITLQYLL